MVWFGKGMSTRCANRLIYYIWTFEFELPVFWRQRWSFGFNPQRGRASSCPKFDRLERERQAILDWSSDELSNLLVYVVGSYARRLWSLARRRIKQQRRRRFRTQICWIFFLIFFVKIKNASDFQNNAQIWSKVNGTTTNATSFQAQFHLIRSCLIT